jgi:hypothetical protein
MIFSKDDESDVQGEKELSPRNVTEAGREIDCNDAQLHDARPQFESVSILIQILRSRVSGTNRNTLCQELQFRGSI